MLGTLGSPRRLPSEIDLALLWSTLMLLVIGMVMVYSASMATAEAGRQTGNQPAYFLVRHSLFPGAACGFSDHCTGRRRCHLPDPAIDLATLVAVALCRRLCVAGAGADSGDWP